MKSMQQAVRTLTIMHQDPEMMIRYADDRERNLFTDGRDLEIEIGGGFLDEKAKWKGGHRLVVQGMSLQGGDMKQTFELSDDGTNLFLTTEIKGDGRMPKMEFLRVYDRAVIEPAAEPDSNESSEDSLAGR